MRLTGIGGKPFLLKLGEILDIEIISSEKYNRTESFKNNVFKIIGDEDRYEHVGRGDTKITLPLYFEDQKSFEKFLSFIDDGNSFMLVCEFFPIISMNIEGDVTIESYYKGFGVARVNLTSASNIKTESDFGLTSALLKRSSETISGVKTGALESLRNFGKDTFDFVSNANQSIGTVTNQVAAYSSAIENVSQGLASTSTIITNTISSITSSASRVIGGVKGVVTSMQNAVNAIRQIPGTVDDLVDDLLTVGDRLNNLFDLGDSNTDNKYNNDLLKSVGVAIIDADLSQSNAAIPEYYPDEDTSNDSTNAPEFFLTSIQNNNTDVISILILTSILLNLYENAENASDWNTVDLIDLKEKTETIYNFIISKNIDSASRLQIDIARNNFFRLFIQNYDKANSVILVKINEPQYLFDIVYSVNGNLDYYYETKKLNNLIGTTVFDDIYVISND